ncbi:MAG: hypothetical protein ACI8RD_014748, partial [Bacillariaceae sp.]
MKDKDGGLSYLQQPLVGSNGTIDSSTANLPLPTRINYQQDNVTHSQAPGGPQTSQAQAQ